MAPWSLTRPAVARLARALAAGDAASVLDAGRLASSVLASDDGATLVLRAVAMLETLLLTASEVSPAVRERLEATSRVLAADGHQAVLALLDRLWDELAALLAPPAAVRPSAAETIETYLAEHLTGRATLGGLARAIGYSRSHVSAVVRQATGERFTELRRRMQLDRACFLLRRGASVKEAALGAGFSDPSYFSRVFARRFGVPPSRWVATAR